MKRRIAITECGYSWGDFAPTHTINPWLGCTFNCDYCWARDWWWRRMRGPLTKAWGVPLDFNWHKPILFDGIVEQVEEELISRRWPSDTRVLLCSMTDPYISGGGEIQISGILEYLANANIQTMILTKAALNPERDFDLLKSMDAWFGMTMDREFSYSNWYYGRMTTLYQAHKEGIKTFVSLEPWLPEVNAEAVIEPMVNFVDHWIVGRLNYKGVGDEFYRENLPGLIEVLEAETSSYYIKPDLMRCLEG